MVDAQRALLDELMGAARNLTEEEKKGYKEIRWDDEEVCPCFLVRFCPHDLFVNTKSNLGPCPKIHDQKLKESFEKSSRHDQHVPRLEAELARFCEKLVSDLDRKLRKGRERIAQDQEAAPLFPLSADQAEQLSTLEEKMQKLLEQIESLGEEGRVDEAQALMKKVDLLNAEKSALIQQSYDRGHPMLQEKKMALCEICGSFLVANDAAERTQFHVAGKQHMGYSMVREFLAEYNTKKDKEKVKKEVEKKKENETERARENGQESRKDGHLNSRERTYRYHERDRHRGRDCDHHDVDRRDRHDGERRDRRDGDRRDHRDADRRDHRDGDRRDHVRDWRTRSRSPPLRSSS